MRDSRGIEKKIKTSCCVLIPFYNAGHTLVESLDSIDYGCFIPDVLVVDDGSEVKAVDVLSTYAGSLNVFIIRLSENRGIEYALNAGLEYCDGKYDYIARLDCGDKCKNNRIQTQVDYLERNPEIYLLGSWAECVDLHGGVVRILRPANSYKQIQKGMYVNNMFVHSSVMFRSCLIKEVGFYPVEFEASEDFAYFFKIVKRFKSENLPSVLLEYRVDPNSISSMKWKAQLISRLKILKSNFYFGAYPIWGLLRSFLLLIFPRMTLFAFVRTFKSH
ncbi:glycosyltransferase [Ketobacter sp. MCCC 1A13808]|uniref:glycosyltransferase n=1 Tax=Ketobacter sp. MCCC 1A13808 TaxID=2602738 RepID=UPI0012EB2A7D|nr:glycosyltransferase [Ketobacter sp. MCCC 1A13808]MVF12927.1 glycosyltransferase [Ketobacter sp. MCCC 1A13808]